MTLQELSEHYQLRAQLEKDEDILYNLRMAGIPSAHPLDGMPRAPGVSDKVGALAIAIVDMGSAGSISTIASTLPPGSSCPKPWILWKPCTAIPN